MSVNVNKVLAEYKVNCSRGAPMGRREWCDDAQAKVALQRVTFVDGDYDRGGAYWGGGGEPLFCAMDDGEKVQLFVRAKNRFAAKQLILERYPDLQIR